MRLLHPIAPPTAVAVRNRDGPGRPSSIRDIDVCLQLRIRQINEKSTVEMDHDVIRPPFAFNVVICCPLFGRYLILPGFLYNFVSMFISAESQCDNMHCEKNLGTR